MHEVRLVSAFSLLVFFVAPPATANITPLDPTEYYGYFLNADLNVNTVLTSAQLNGVTNPKGFSINGSFTFNPDQIVSNVRDPNPYFTIVTSRQIYLDAGVYQFTNSLNISISDPNSSSGSYVNSVYFSSYLFFNPSSPGFVVGGGFSRPQGIPSTCPLSSCTGLAGSYKSASYKLPAGDYVIESFFVGYLMNVASGEAVTFNIDTAAGVGDGIGPGRVYPAETPEPRYYAALGIGIAGLILGKCRIARV